MFSGLSSYRSLLVPLVGNGQHTNYMSCCPLSCVEPTMKISCTLNDLFLFLLPVHDALTVAWHWHLVVFMRGVLSRMPSVEQIGQCAFELVTKWH